MGERHWSLKIPSLTDMLANGACPAPRAPVVLRMAPVVAMGRLVNAVFALLGMGSIPAAMQGTPAPWRSCSVVRALRWRKRWRPPDSRNRWRARAWPMRSVLAVFATTLPLGTLTRVTPAPDHRMAALLGETWLTCPRNVVALSLSALAGALWAWRGLAPTQLRVAGFNAGLTAGALGVMGYSLPHPKGLATFVAAWHSHGILLTGLLGAFLGPRWLRW